MPWNFYEAAIIRFALEKCGTVAGAADKLGLDRKTVMRKMKQYQIVFESRRRRRDLLKPQE